MREILFKAWVTGPVEVSYQGLRAFLLSGRSPDSAPGR